MESEYVLLALAAVIAVGVIGILVAGITYLCWLGGRLFALPGVVVHEFAHKTACNMVGVRVVEVVYFRLGDPAGYVAHEQPRRYRASFVISVAPFLVNTIVSFAVFLGFATLVSGIGSVGDVRSAPIERIAAVLVLGWLGLSIGVSAFPSTGDASTLWNRSRAEWRDSPIVLLGIPVVAVIYAANLLSWLWADVLYALALGLLALSVAGVVTI